MTVKILLYFFLSMKYLLEEQENENINMDTILFFFLLTLFKFGNLINNGGVNLEGACYSTSLIKIWLKNVPLVFFRTIRLLELTEK